MCLGSKPKSRLNRSDFRQVVFQNKSIQPVTQKGAVEATPQSQSPCKPHFILRAAKAWSACRAAPPQPRAGCKDWCQGVPNAQEWCYSRSKLLSSRTEGQRGPVNKEVDTVYFLLNPNISSNCKSLGSPFVFTEGDGWKIIRSELFPFKGRKNV